MALYTLARTGEGAFQMPEENKKRGRPKGHPKTGGRKKGTPNKNNRRLRFEFEARGFDFVDEFMLAFRGLGNPKDFAPSQLKMEALLKVAPFFMQRLREDRETSEDTQPSDQDDPRLSTADLLKLVGK